MLYVRLAWWSAVAIANALVFTTGAHEILAGRTTAIWPGVLALAMLLGSMKLAADRILYIWNVERPAK